MRISLALILAFSAVACKKAPLAVSSESGGDHASGSAACEETPSGTPAHCECIGGYVKGDIGDGKVACTDGDVELERVQQGIEGAVCCRARQQ